MDPDRSAQGRDPHTQYDLRHIFLSVGRAILEHLITRTALGCDLEARRSAQRFERDTYHGDALPTELRGRVLSCLTWGFVPRGGQLTSCTTVHSAEPDSNASDRVTRSGRWRAYRTPAVVAPSPRGVQPVPAPSAPTRTTGLCWPPSWPPRACQQPS